MKKVLVQIFLILICYFGYGQSNPYPLTQNLGSSVTKIQIPTYGGITGGLIPLTFADTTAANTALTYGKTYNGFLIYTTSPAAVWWRYATNNQWIQVLPSGSSGGQRPWLIGGNSGLFTSPIDPQYVGVKTNQGFGFLTNNTARATIPNTGIARTSDAKYKYLLIDTSGTEHYLAYGDGGSSSVDWALDGNTIGSEKWLGSIDNFKINFRTNSLRRLTINENGAFGLGTGEDYGTAGLSLITNGSSSAPTYAYPTTPINNLLGANGTNTIDNGNNAQLWSWNTLQAANGLSLASNSTTASAGGQLLFSVGLSGANASANRTTTAAYFENNHTGTNSTNIAARFSASSGTNNYAIDVENGGVRFQTLTSSANVDDSMMVVEQSTGKVGYRAIPTSSGGTVTGSGTENYIPKWNNAGGTQLGNSLIYDDGTNVGIGTASPTTRLQINTNSTLKTFRIGSVATGSFIDKFFVDTSGLFEAGRYATTGFYGVRFNPSSGLMAFTRSVDGNIICSIDPSSNKFSAGTANVSLILNQSSNSGISVATASNAAFTNGSSTTYWNIGSVGIQAGTDNTYDIGASGATRPRTGYFGTSIVNPLLIGGTGTTSTLTYKPTTGVGTTGADHIFQVGNNGATEAMRILNNGNVGIGTASPGDKLSVTGNIALNTAGNKLKIATGSNASIGTATLSSGTVTVSTTAVATASIIVVTYNTPSGTLASGLSAPVSSIVNGTSFVINSLTTAGVVNTLDNSTVNWWIIN